jgi:hypothetical protein
MELQHTMDDMVCLSMTHIHMCGYLIHCFMGGDFPSRWLQLQQWPLVPLLGVPVQVEESLLQI